MAAVNNRINRITQFSLLLDDDDEMQESMNAELDKEIEKDMEIINEFVSKKAKSNSQGDVEKDEASINEYMSNRVRSNPQILKMAEQTISEVEKIQQEMFDDDDVYQTMNAELDKQVAEDMEAINDYLSKSDESVANRIEFFNKMDKTPVAHNETRVTDHILYQHTPLGNIKWHECTQCDFKAMERSKLMEHLMTSHPSLTEVNKNGKQPHSEEFACKDCDKEFNTNSEMLRHMEEAHNAVVYKCDQCSFVSNDERDLRQHVMMQHVKLNISWYKCSQCSYRTGRKACLDRHITYKHSNTILL